MRLVFAGLMMLAVCNTSLMVTAIAQHEGQSQGDETSYLRRNKYEIQQRVLTSSYEQQQQQEQQLNYQQDRSYFLQCQEHSMPYVWFTNDGSGTDVTVQEEYYKYFQQFSNHFDTTLAEGTLPKQTYNDETSETLLYLRPSTTTVPLLGADTRRSTSYNNDDHKITFILWGKTRAPPTFHQQSQSIVSGNVASGVAPRRMAPVYISAFNNQDEYVETLGPRGISYVRPDEYGTDILNEVVMKSQEQQQQPPLQVFEGDHVALFIDHYATFAHIVIDMIPYIAYLKETMPPNAKLLLPNSKNILKNFISLWDPIFASTKVSWIDLPQGFCKDDIMIQIYNGSLTVANPSATRISLRHMEFLASLRRWIDNNNNELLSTAAAAAATTTTTTTATALSYPESSLSDSSSFAMSRGIVSTGSAPAVTTSKTPSPSYIIYYTRNNPTAEHARAMDVTQEEEIIETIRNYMKRYNRSEELIIFDGTISIEEQYNLFRHTTMVIGAHGGGLSNLLFLPSATTCQQRPKVLEFMTNPDSSEVQEGNFGRTYYRIYSTIPWVEYHHLLYTSESERDRTFIHMSEFYKAMDTMFTS